MEVEIIKKRENNELTNNDDNSQRLKVAAYARVSTDLEDQKTSFISQQKYYLEKITENPKWMFVEVYADEGISGTQAFKRENFMRMIKDAENGKIDLILTKSISRFARNTLDTLKYVRLLKANGIGIIFEEEGINTLDMAGELLLTVLSSVAQQESETISSHIRLGYKMKRERGELVGFSSCYGYTYDSKTNTMYINEKEAEIVKLIYNNYLKGFGSTMISNILYEMKIPSPQGKERWQSCTINGILHNEIYKGDVIQGKTYTVDSITHKRKKNNGEEDMYYIKDHHEPIIDKELFDQVQDIAKSRSNQIQRGRKEFSTSPLSGRMRCGFCGKSYSRRKNNSVADRIYWVCMSLVRGNKNLCPESKALPESVIRTSFMEAFYLLNNNNGLALDEFLEDIKESIKDHTPIKMKQNAVIERDKYKDKLSKLIDLYIEGKIEKETYERKQKALEAKIDEINQKIDSLSKIEDEQDKYELNIKKIKNELKSRESINQVKEFDPILFDNLVDYIIIGGFDENNQKNEYLIRFICRNGFYKKSREDISDEVIVTNGLNNDYNNIYIPVLDFISTQKFFVFDLIDGKRTKRCIDKVRVRVELEK